MARSLVILALAMGLAGAPAARGQVVAAGAGAQKSSGADGAGVVSAVTPSGQYRDVFTLNDAGSPQIEMHGIDSRHEIYFTLPQTHVVRTAKIHIYYAFSPSLLPQLSHIKLMMNGTLFATVQPTPGQLGGSDSHDAEAEFTIPPELLVHSNTLTIQFIGHYTMVCEDPANTTLWARVHRNTYLDIEGDLLPLADDLKQLPMPFLDPAVIQPLSIPIVFASAPSFKAIQAAGVVSSYFGLISENRPVRFPVHIGQLPQGNAIVVTDNAGSLDLFLRFEVVVEGPVREAGPLPRCRRSGHRGSRHARRPPSPRRGVAPGSRRPFETSARWVSRWRGPAPAWSTHLSPSVMAATSMYRR